MNKDNIPMSAILGAITFASFGFYYYLRNKYNYWNKKGVRGPTPIWPLGNFHRFLRKDKIKTHYEYYKKYGKIYGLYAGTRPQLMISDVDLINQICIKDFDAFTDHYSDNNLNEYQRSFLFFLKGDHWRRVRAFMSPTFTSGKIKRMFKLLDVCANDLVLLIEEQISEQNNQKKSAIVNVKEIYSLYTMDAITNCCYSLKLQRDSSVKSITSAGQRNEFVRQALRVFNIRVFRFFVSLLLPIKLLNLIGFYRFPLYDFDPMRLNVEKMMQKRRQQPEKKFNDYLQLIMDAKLSDSLDFNESDLNENHHAGLTSDLLIKDQEQMLKSTNKESILSDFEIVTSGMFMIFVGVETTALLLTQSSYILACHQDYQEKLYNEIRKIVGPNNSFEYEQLTSCHYLDAVLSETLRIMPPFPFLSRIATKDYKFEKYNLTIDKGQELFLAGSSIMMDPENFEEPEKFKPERFLPGNREKIKPGAYCPFGLGPRHCLGMRFSLTEAKLALAKIMMKFQFHPAPGESFPAMPLRNPFLNSVVKAPIEITPRNL